MDLQSFPLTFLGSQRHLSSFEYGAVFKKDQAHVNHIVFFVLYFFLYLFWFEYQLETIRSTHHLDSLDPVLLGLLPDDQVQFESPKKSR